MKAIRTALTGATAAVLLSAVPARAQAPSLSTNWLKTTLTEQECFDKANKVFSKFKMLRVERVGTSLFGDTPDKVHQAVIRCVAAHQVVFFVAAGGSKSAKIVDKWTVDLRAAFDAP